MCYGVDTVTVVSQREENTGGDRIRRLGGRGVGGAATGRYSAERL